MVGRGLAGVSPEYLEGETSLGRLGKFLRREGEDPILPAKFYRVVVQAVLLFGSETWVLTAAMLEKLEGFHVSFLRQVTGMKA